MKSFNFKVLIWIIESHYSKCIIHYDIIIKLHVNILFWMFRLLWLLLFLFIIFNIIVNKNYEYLV